MGKKSSAKREVRDRKISQPKYCQFKMPHTRRSLDVFRAGILGLIYFKGTPQTTIHSRPFLPRGLSDFGHAVLDWSKEADSITPERRSESLSEVLTHPGARGIKTVAQLEWLAFGVAAVWENHLIDWMATETWEEITDKARILAHVFWADRMYGPSSLHFDPVTDLDLGKFVAMWQAKTLKPPKTPLFAVWAALEVAQAMAKEAKRIEQDYFERLGGGTTCDYGASQFSDDKDGVAPWERDSFTYWSHFVQKQTYPQLRVVWPLCSLDHAKTRSDAVGAFLRGRGELPICSLLPATELHSKSKFVTEFAAAQLLPS